MKEIKESSADDTTDDDWILEYPRAEVNNQGNDEEGWVTAKRGRKQKKTNPTKLAPLITMGKDVVYKPLRQRELKAIVGDFPKDVKK